MFPFHDFEARFREILGQLDALREGARGAEAAEMDELNANFEDALFVVECIEPGDEDGLEAFSDALDEFRDLTGAYRAIEAAVPGLAEAVERLDAAVRFAAANL